MTRGIPLRLLLAPCAAAALFSACGHKSREQRCAEMADYLLGRELDLNRRCTSDIDCRVVYVRPDHPVAATEWPDDAELRRVLGEFADQCDPLEPWPGRVQAVCEPPAFGEEVPVPLRDAGFDGSGDGADAEGDASVTDVDRSDATPEVGADAAPGDVAPDAADGSGEGSGDDVGSDSGGDAADVSPVDAAPGPVVPLQVCVLRGEIPRPDFGIGGDADAGEPDGVDTAFDGSGAADGSGVDAAPCLCASNSECATGDVCLHCYCYAAASCAAACANADGCGRREELGLGATVSICEASCTELIGAPDPDGAAGRDFAACLATSACESLRSCFSILP